MKTWKCWPLFVVCCLVIALFCGQSASAKEFVLKGGNSVGEKVWQNVLCQKWVDLINEYSQGKIKAENYPNAVLGSDNAMIEKTMFGSIQWSYASTSNLSRLLPEMNTYELPYIADDSQANLKLFYTKDGKLGGPITERLQQALAKKNLRLCWVSSTFYRAIYNSKHEIRLPKDCNDLKLRVTASEPERLSVSSWGAAAVPMGYGEVYTALQQGTIDGLGVNMPEGIPMKFYEVCPYASYSKFNAYSAVVVMNLDVWNSLPDDLKAIIEKASEDTIKFDTANRKTLYDDPYEKELLDRGMNIYTPTPEEEAVWKKQTMEKVWPELIGKTVKQEWVDLWRKQLNS